MFETASLANLPPMRGSGSPPASAAMAPAEGEPVSAQAAAALAAFQSDALSETAEDVGFALGARRVSADHRRAKVATWKLVAELSSVEPAVLDGLLADADSWLHVPNLQAALAQYTNDRGRKALMLAAALARGGLTSQQKGRLEAALSALLDEEDIALALFGALHLGVRTPGLRQDLHRLYLCANETRRPLSAWLADLGERDTRRQRLCAMIQVLAFELSVSGAPIVGSHLAAVIGDLQRLLQLLGLEGHCHTAAARLACPAVDGEWLLDFAVRLSEQLWTDAALVAQTLPQTAPTYRYPLARTLYQLIQVMPTRAFVDDEHRERVLSALAELRDRYSE